MHMADIAGDEISIHALHEESDQPAIRSEPAMSSAFQSTLSMRRATQDVDRHLHRGVISIHALHEESDQRNQPDRIRRHGHFNPRSP